MTKPCIGYCDKACPDGYQRTGAVAMSGAVACAGIGALIIDRSSIAVTVD